jgi:hypothetical protein
MFLSEPFFLRIIFALRFSASGALFGLLGSALGAQWANWPFLNATSRVHELRILLIIVGLNIIFSFSSKHIDVRAHAGGLVSGLFCGAALLACGPPTSSSSAFPTSGGRRLDGSVNNVSTLRTAIAAFDFSKRQNIFRVGGTIAALAFFLTLFLIIW